MKALVSPKLSSTTTDVNIVYTTPEATRAALALTNSFVSGLAIRVHIFAFQVVPFPLELENPVVPADFAVQQIIHSLDLPKDAAITLHYALCRDADDALMCSLKAHSVVVIAGRNRVGKAKEMRLARKLEGLGHEVVFVPMR